MSTTEREAISGVTIAGASAAAPAAAEPARPVTFYIQSEVHNSDWVLSRNSEGKVRLAHKDGSIGQLWMREDDPRGGFFLVNLGSGEVLYQTRLQGGEITLKPKNLSDSAMLWRLEDWRAPWKGLHAFRDREQKLNLAGNGPYNENTVPILWEYSRQSPNECWQLIPDTGKITVESITYDMSKANKSLEAPALCQSVRVDNRTQGGSMETSVELTRSVTFSRQFTHTHSTSDALKIATKLGVKLSVEKIAEVTGEVTTDRTKQTTITSGQQTTESTTVADKISVKVAVPPRACYDYMVRVSYGKITVPYKATLSRDMPNGTKEYSEVSGQFTNVDSTKYEIVAVDAASGATVQTLPLPADAAAPPRR